MIAEELIEQLEKQAILYAKEFSNRQTLLSGEGAPAFQAPLGVEYEDRSFVPPKRYRKTGTEQSAWKEVKLLDVASEEEVQSGLNQHKVITPYTLNQQLNAFSQTVLNLPTANEQEPASKLIAVASSSEDGSAFSIAVPTQYKHSFLSVEIKGYGLGAILSQIDGAEVGQLITLRRGESHPLQIEANQSLKLSAIMQLSDPDQLDQLSLQKITADKWVEVSRMKFS